MANDLFGLADLAAHVEQAFLAAARDSVPVRTGTLRDSLNIRTTQGADSASLELWGIDYGKYVITGTAAHDIFPVVKQALFWPGAGHPYAHVSHPGTQANDFRPAIVEAMGPLLEAMGRESCSTAIQNIKRRLPNAA